ncbi:MAG: Deoxyhypusine synthase-like protein [Gammaproteobacteria bacterium]|jgi:deoxyhypusine synthase|nr:Deoxyhypusine synthase-like protein [Gammaproteobacteria bacterium]
MSHDKSSLLNKTVEHLDLTGLKGCAALVKAMGDTAFQARNLSRATDIYEMMLKDKDCMIILCLAGSLVSAGMKKIIVDMIENNMIDAIVSTGANIVDQDFFEGLGFRHYQANPYAVDDNKLQEMMIDRIYDTYIDEENLRDCDHTIFEIANKLTPRAYSSREFIQIMGAYLMKHGKNKNSIVRAAYEKNLPIFVPAFSDCSAGFGLVLHQVKNPEKHLAIDSVKDFRELTELKIGIKDSGLLMLGGGVPKNFAQDIVVAAELLDHDAAMHKYAVQITVADERDGALSGSTLREACSWGKVSTTFEQMVFAEATLAFPLLAAAAFENGAAKQRSAKHLSKQFPSLMEEEAKM